MILQGKGWKKLFSECSGYFLGEAWSVYEDLGCNNKK